MQDRAEFYVTGGTLSPDSASYIPRAADAELLAALQRGELCYVLNARQMGKSSLSVRTRQALEAAGTKTVFLDLQKFGSSASAEQWYAGMLAEMGRALSLRPAFLAYWRDNAHLPPLTRVFGALRKVALAQLPGNLVVFLDEIDVVRDLDFKTDEFFGAIRESHNARSDDPALSRLTFCIIGTVAPTDLIRDVRLSPFNIGTRVKLSDFTALEAAPLAAPLPGGTKTLERVLWWTSGHPYLTQRLCAELSKASSVDVDGMVSRLFFSKSDSDVDENIKNVRNGVLRMGGDGAGFDRVDLLTRYGKIVAGKRVPDDDTDGVCTALRLSGLVASSDGLLRPRNRVYATLFDAAWVRDNLPDAELRRQKAAVSKARWQIGSIAAAVLLCMGTLTTLAITSRNDAQTSADTANRLAYIANSNLTQGAIEENNFELAQQYLDDMGNLLKRSSRLEAGFEWFYLNKLMNLELLQLKGHSEKVTSVVFSSDGKRIMTGSRDTTARLWDSSTGRETLQLKGHTRSVRTDAQAAEMVTKEALANRVAALSTVPLAELANQAKALLAQHTSVKAQIAVKLNEAAWKRVDPSKPHPTPAVARQSREVAQLAVQLTQQKDGLILDTLAAAQFACGDLESALATQRKAVKLLPDNKDLAASLARYEKLWAEPSKGQKGPCLV